MILFLFKCDFKLVFNNLNPHIKTDFCHNTTFINLEQNLLYWIDFINHRGYKFSHIIEMNITTVNDEMNMTHEHYLEQPKRMLEGKLIER